MNLSFLKYGYIYIGVSEVSVLAKSIKVSLPFNDYI
jgi:hypothetical protein